MIVSGTFSRPTKEAEVTLGKPYIKIRIWKTASLLSTSGYEAEFFTQTQSFRKHLSQKEADTFFNEHAGTLFKNAVLHTEDKEITVMANRHGKITRLEKALKEKGNTELFAKNHNRTKNYLFEEGKPVPFLVSLGVMSKEGKVIAQKYDKFRQINRFAEYIADIIPSIEKRTGDKGFTQERPLRVIDFGSGKSYLTFATYHYLHEIKRIPVDIIGLDLKKDVIEECEKLARNCGYDSLHFSVGDIADFTDENQIDLVITLHACDTATDYALNFAVTHDASAILSVPCCQHEINLQLEKKAPLPEDNPLSTLLHYPLIRERIAALATDALRAEELEKQGYSVQALEFIDMSHTPKNLMLRAIKNDLPQKKKEASAARSSSLRKALSVSQTLHELLKTNSPQE